MARAERPIRGKPADCGKCGGKGTVAFAVRAGGWVNECRRCGGQTVLSSGPQANPAPPVPRGLPR